MWPLGMSPRALFQAVSPAPAKLSSVPNWGSSVAIGGSGVPAGRPTGHSSPGRPRAGGLAPPVRRTLPPLRDAQLPQRSASAFLIIVITTISPSADNQSRCSALPPSPRRARRAGVLSPISQRRPLRSLGFEPPFQGTGWAVADGSTCWGSDCCLREHWWCAVSRGDVQGQEWGGCLGPRLQRGHLLWFSATPTLPKGAWPPQLASGGLSDIDLAPPLCLIGTLCSFTGSSSPQTPTGGKRTLVLLRGPPPSPGSRGTSCPQASISQAERGPGAGTWRSRGLGGGSRRGRDSSSCPPGSREWTGPAGSGKDGRHPTAGRVGDQTISWERAGLCEGAAWRRWRSLRWDQAAAPVPARGR